MNEFHPPCQKSTPGFFNRSWSGWHHYQVIGAAETILLPCLIGIISLTGLDGNSLIVLKIIRYLSFVQPFHLTHLRTRSNTIRVNLCLWVASLILMLTVWAYSEVIKFKDGLESCAFDLTSPDDVLWYTLYLTITTFFFPLPLIFICYILILCYTWEMYQQNKKAGSTVEVTLRDPAL